MTKARALSRTPTSDGSSSSSPERPAYGDDSDDFVHLSNDDGNSITDQLPGFRNMAVSSSPAVQRARKSPFSRRKYLEYQTTPVYSLPPELLIAIFSKLSDAADLRNCLLVCKSWAACSVELLWHRPCITTWKCFLRLAEAIRSKNPTFLYPLLIRRLNLTFLAKEISDGTLKCLFMCERLERLTLTNCKDLTDSGLSNLIRNNPGLLALDLSSLCQLTDHTLESIANSCPRLQGLNIAGCHRVTNASLIQLSQNCKQLKRLKLNDCELITDEAVIAMAQNCPQLLEVDLHKCVQITDESLIRLLTDLRQIRELHLAFCQSISDNAFHAIPNRQIESLRIIDLTNCELITDESVIKIISIAPRLRNLVLAKCKNITDRGVESICRLGKWIHYLALGHCLHITDRSVIKIAKSCNRIRYIDLAGCQHLTDASVCELAHLPKLKRVGLVKCVKITDNSIIALVTKPQVCVLERVHLSYCTKLTLHGITKLLNRCFRLTHLSLTGIETFLHAELKQFCREPPEEFTPHQREVFCVFSGQGVNRLRHHLSTKYTRTRIPYTPFPEFVNEEEGSPTAEHGEEEIDFGWGAGHTAANGAGGASDAQ
ncbi:hypothetical protein BDZ91DRAFT_693482 [Kalaharituber pfeilii]|nr:hypothetical protein BDZ91DRAFT_693482 [Kalaharituber pfeilii]